MNRRRSTWRNATLAALIALGAAWAAPATAADFDPAEPAPGNMRFAWIHGSISAMHNTDPRVQVHRYNEHTYIMRQNPAVHWEAPFMYLLMGETGAVLIDTGATEEAEYFPLRATVDALLARYEDANGTGPLDLVVLTTSDAPAQTAGLGQFMGRPDTTILGPGASDALDLGGRTLTLLPTPGVSAAGRTIYDPYTDFLFTGTTLLPGRVVIRDFDAYMASMERLVEFADTHPVKWVMGGQIDMSAWDGVDYRLRSNYRPVEHALQLDASALRECHDVTKLINGAERVEILPDFIVMNGVGRGQRAYGYPVYTPESMRSARLR